MFLGTWQDSLHYEKVLSNPTGTGALDTALLKRDARIGYILTQMGCAGSAKGLKQLRRMFQQRRLLWMVQALNLTVIDMLSSDSTGFFQN